MSSAQPPARRSGNVVPGFATWRIARMAAYPGPITCADVVVFQTYAKRTVLDFAERP
jgi:hypothetical protein